MLLSYKPLHLEAQQYLQEEGCLVDIRRVEELKTRLGAGRGLLLWISLSVALLSRSGFKLKLIFYRCARGVPFLVRAISRLLDLFGLGLTSIAFPSQSSSRAGPRKAHTRQARASTAPGAHLLRGPLKRGDKLSRILRNPSPHDPALSWS